MSAKLGLRTEASARYEKSLDPNMTDLAIKRLAYLLKEQNPDMVIASNLTDVYPNVLKEEQIILDKKTLSNYMGKTLEDEMVKNILEKLGFKVQVENNFYDVTVPTFRATKDIKIKEDLIEEIARIYGLENFVPKPLKLDLTITEHETIYNQEYEVKHLLASKYDMHEVHSYIWYDTETLKELNIEKKNVSILGKEANNILRDDLSLSLMNIVKENFKNYGKFQIFEIGTIIENNKNKRVLSIILTDNEKNLESIYNEAKKIVKYIFKVLKNKEITFTSNINELDYYDKTLGKIINIENNKIGTLNVLNKSCTNKLSKKKAIVTIDIDFDKYVKLNKDTILSKEISKYPEVELDYTIILENKKYEDLEKVLKTFLNKLIKNYHLVEVYENKYLIRYTLGSDFKTLEQKDLQSFQEQFIKHIKDNGLNIVE